MSQNPNTPQPAQYGPPPQQPAQYGQGPATGIQVHASFFPMSFFLFFCTPVVVIDNQAYRAGWNKPFFFPVPPGVHTIKIFFHYLWMSECGANSAQVNIVPGRVSTVEYFMPPWMYAAGSITLG